MYCKKCGRQLPDTAHFCPGCGAEMSSKPRRSVDGIPKNYLLIGMTVLVIALLCMLMMLLNKSDSKNAQQTITSETEVQTSELTLEEKIDEALKYLAWGDIDSSEEKLEELAQEYKKNADFYLVLSEKLLDLGMVEPAKEFLLYGFEETEDSRMMEKYLDISIEYAADGKGESYKKLAELAELLAKATGNSEKLDAAKEIYFWIKRVQ